MEKIIYFQAVYNICSERFILKLVFDFDELSNTELILGSYTDGDELSKDEVVKKYSDEVNRLNTNLYLKELEMKRYINSPLDKLFNVA